MTSYRKVLQDSKCKDIVMARSSPQDASNIERVLSIMCLEPKNTVEIDEPNPCAPPIPNSWLGSNSNMNLALVPHGGTSDKSVNEDWAEIPDIDAFLHEFDEEPTTAKTAHPTTAKADAADTDGAIIMCFDTPEQQPDPFNHPDLIAALMATPLPAGHHQISRSAKGKDAKQKAKVVNSGASPVKSDKKCKDVGAKQKAKSGASPVKSDKKNVHSRAYHKARSHAIKVLNMTPDKAKELLVHMYDDKCIHMLHALILPSGLATLHDLK